MYGKNGMKCATRKSIGYLFFLGDVFVLSVPGKYFVGSIIMLRVIIIIENINIIRGRGVYFI